MQELREDSSDELSIPGNALGLRLTLLLWWITLLSPTLPNWKQIFTRNAWISEAYGFF